MGDPFRARLLVALAEHEACVCHLERRLGKRQAYISQHLMHLRKAGLLTARRKGKFVFYALKDSEMLGLLKVAMDLTGTSVTDDALFSKVAKCNCPRCTEQKETEC